MRKMTAGTIVLGLLSGWTAAAVPKGFQKTYADAQRLARESGRPMYLHFTILSSEWCRRIEQDCYAVEAGKKVLAEFVPASLDCTVAKDTQPTGEVRFNLDLLSKFGGCAKTDNTGDILSARPESSLLLASVYQRD